MFFMPCEHYRRAGKVFPEEEREAVKVFPEEERERRNTKMIADVALEKAKDSLNRCNIADLKFHRLERLKHNKVLKARGLTEENRNEMMERKQGIEYWIDVVTAEQKRLKLDVSTK
jgi:hypothetical protein